MPKGQNIFIVTLLSNDHECAGGCKFHLKDHRGRYLTSILVSNNFFFLRKKLFEAAAACLCKADIYA